VARIQMTAQQYEIFAIPWYYTSWYIPYFENACSKPASGISPPRISWDIIGYEGYQRI
jgi:hypothetical protein